VPRLPEGRLARLAVLFGLAAALALLWASVQVYRLAGGAGGGAEVAPALWAAVVAPVVAVCAALLTPRRFMVGVLFGWIGGVTAIFATVSAIVAEFQSGGAQVDDSPTILLALALLGLLVVTVLLARRSRAAPPSEGEPTVRG
jgi:tellurite resistance protein TehA-like permease